jgi:stage II sporulation protein D
MQPLPRRCPSATRDMDVARASSRTTQRAVVYGVVLVVCVAGGCVQRATSRAPDVTPPPIPSTELAGRLDFTDRMARIAITGGVPQAPVSATGTWRIDEQGGRQSLVRGAGGESWRIEQRARLLRIVGAGTDATPWRAAPFVARSTSPAGFVQYNGKRYRGELWFAPTDSGIMVVNRLPVEDYLRGVVPLELGTRSAADRAALEAQAIAARSYSYARVPAGDGEPTRGWHMVGTVTNQVYGGVDVEHPMVTQAIEATSGLVLRYNGLTVDAPYSAACGGRSATPKDAWRDVREQPYLQSVDDLDLSTGKPFCDINPRNHWTEELGEQQITDAVRRALEGQGATAPQASSVRGVQVVDRSPSGRVNALVFHTVRGDITIQGRDIRAVLRDARGAILSSTYFSVDREARGGDRIAGLTLRGNGNGHGVGMCQWGAMGRARAGQDARTILRHYYPGTIVGFAD